MTSAPSHLALTTDTVGGVWRYTMELAAGLAARGIGATVITLGPSPTLAQRAEVAGACASLIDTGLPLDWTAPDRSALAAVSEQLVSMVAQTGCDGIHLHAPALADAAFHRPVVAVAHSCVATWWHAVEGDAPLPDALAWRAAATARGLSRADAVVAPTHAFAAALHDAYRLSRSIAVVHNGRALPDEQPSSRAGVLAAGRLWDRAKGLDILDRVARDQPIAAAGPVAGPNGEVFGASHLRLLGTLDDAMMRAAMRQAAVFASPARYEPFGLAVLEAAAAGCALVLSDIPTFHELWDGVATFVASEDPAAWGEALRRAGDGGPARARAARYTADRMVAATLDVHRTTRAARLAA